MAESPVVTAASGSSSSSRASPGGSASSRDAEVEGGTEARLLALRERVDEALRSLLEEELDSRPPAVADPVRHAVLGPGKRIRPLLLLAAHESAGGDADAAVPLSCSVELIHAYSLVHDDLPCMDDDVLRRGRATLHVRYGPAAAVLAGAALMPLAARTVWRAGERLDLSEARVRRLLALLTTAAGAAGMVGGQLRDLRAEGRELDRGELETIHRGKTAALMAAALRMGGVAAGADETLVTRLGSFGEKLGLAFQAIDDILDVTGSDRQLGKTSGRDAALGKATYPSVLGLSAARRVAEELYGEARAELDGLPDAELLGTVADHAVRRRR